MSFFALLFMCLQACLIQNVYSQYLAGPGMAAPALRSRSFGAGLAAPLTATGPAGGYGLGAGVAGCGAAYGGAGAGNVAVAGELPVGGSTVVGGQVPIIGGVEFGGAVPATGVVTISGTCSCGCGY